MADLLKHSRAPLNESITVEDIHRRRFLHALGLTVAGTAVTQLFGCASAPVEQTFDPTSIVYPPPPEPPRYYYDSTIWGSYNVVEETSTDRMRRALTGEKPTSKGFAKPFGVAAHRGVIYVSDTVARRVHVLDFQKKTYRTMGGEGIGRMEKPLGMATDAAGNLYVCDGTLKRVTIFDPDGNYINAVGGEAELSRPTDVTVSADGQRIFVVDTGGVSHSNHGVAIFGPDRRIIKSVGKRGSGENEFNLPLAATIGPDGNLYVVDTGNFRVQVLDPEGGFLRAFGEAGRYPGQFGHPKSIAIDSKGIIYITDTNFGIVQLFNLEGRILMSMGERSESGGPGKLLLPAGIAADVDRRIYVTAQFFQKVEVFRPADLPIDWPTGAVYTV